MSGLGIRRRIQPVLIRVRRGWRRGRRWVFRARLDLRDRLRGERDPLLPPRRKNLPSPMARVGERMVDALVEHADLGPDSDVLDIGCGPGRIAASLTRRLDPGSGSYEGFDVMPASIRWCQKAITPRHPNFRFQLADLHNAQYNPEGSQSAAEYRFPYPDRSFDVAIASSLFTHLRPFEAEHYLAETARVLRQGGRLMGTWFLINEESEELISQGRARLTGILTEGRPPLRFEHELSDERGNRFRAGEVEVPEHRIGAYEQEVRAQYERAGLRIVATRYGSWPGRETESLGHDLIAAERV